MYQLFYCCFIKKKMNSSSDLLQMINIFKDKENIETKNPMYMTEDETMAYIIG